MWQNTCWVRTDASFYVFLQESGDDGFDTDSYSGIVDLMSLCGGTPTIQRRHESVSVSKTVYLKLYYSLFCLS
jgi:hypothetical protein